MKFAYLLLVHKNPRQLQQLVDSLSEDDTVFVIHVDKKTDETTFKKLLTTYRNVFFCPKRKDVKWGGFSQIEATLELIRTLFAEVKEIPDYVHLMSGQDFPIKSNKYIFNFFKKNNGLNFMEFEALPYIGWKDGGMDRILHHWQVDTIGATESLKLQSTQQTHEFFPDIIPYGGSQWWSLTGDCIKRIYKECYPGNRLYDFYKHTFCPDEMFFQTILLNSAIKDTVVNNNLRKIDWTGKEQPAIFKLKDRERLLNSPRLFARKFDETIDLEIIEQISQDIHLDKSPQEPSVSVVLVMYNAEKHLHEAIESILNQTFMNFELIIVDDGSTDNSIEIVKGFNDPRILLTSNQHNYIDALNTGLLKARGKYIARMDADDVMLPERLELQYDYMETHPDVDVCGSWTRIIYDKDSEDNEESDDRIIKSASLHDDISLTLLMGNALSNPSTIIRRESLLKHGILYKKDYPYAEDYKMWIDFAKADCRFANIPQVLLAYRLHDSQVTSKHHHTMLESKTAIQFEYVQFLMSKISENDHDYLDLMNQLILTANKGLLKLNGLLGIVYHIYKDHLTIMNEITPQHLESTIEHGP